MQFFLIFSAITLVLSNSIMGREALGFVQQLQLEQFLPEIYSWLRSGDRTIDQTQAFQALERMYLLLENTQALQREDSEFLQQFENQVPIVEYSNQIKDVFDQKLHKSQQIDDQIQIFLKDELKRTTEYLTIMIKDKEKMIEQDNRELDKIKKKNGNDKQKQENKLIEITKLIQDIEQGLEHKNEANLFKLLEVIESKASIGLLFYEKQYEEIDYFLKSVDQIFKNKNFLEDKESMIYLISLVQNVLQDIRMRILVKFADEKMESFDTLSFFEGSKQTHIKAKDYFEVQLNSFSNNLTQTWSKMSQDERNIKNDTVQLQKWLIQFKEESQASIQKLMNLINVKQLAIKHIETEFLQPLKRQ